MSELAAIVYVSSAAHLVSDAELKHLLTRARERNAEEDITGCLLYAEGSFMQYIEGPRARLERVYAIIRADPLHHQLFELANEAVSAREFADWSMAYAPTGAPDFVNLSGAQWQAMERTSPAVNAVHGRQLLRQFWREQRQHRY